MMNHVFPVEPQEGWKEGDIAYCVRAKTPRKNLLEVGRVYIVADAKKPSNIGHHGLKLRGIDTGESWGFWSNRFIKIHRPPGNLAAIDAATRYTMEHYWSKSDQSEKGKSL